MRRRYPADAQRPTVLQVLLDAGVLVERVDGDIDPAGDDAGLEHLLHRRRPAPPDRMPGEDQLDLVGAADVQVVRDQGLEESAGVAGLGEHDGARHLDLAHRQFPPVPGGLIGVGQWHRQDREPALGELGDLRRAEPVADGLQPGGVIGGGEPVGQLGEPDPGVDRLTLGPLMAVDPDLGRVGEVSADLDEPRTEVVVPEVEVIAGHTPVGLVEGEPRSPGRPLPLGPGEHTGVLLGDPDRGHPGPARLGLGRQVGPHGLDLAVGLGEPHHRDVVLLGEAGHRPAERGTDLVEDRRGRDRIAQVRGQEADHLPADLQVVHPAVQIDPIQTLQIQRHLPVEDVVHGHRLGHDPQRCRSSPARPAHHLGGPRRSLTGWLVSFACWSPCSASAAGGFRGDVGAC